MARRAGVVGFEARITGLLGTRNVCYGQARTECSCQDSAYNSYCCRSQVGTFWGCTGLDNMHSTPVTADGDVDLRGWARTR
jgi:hypothetical protein